jgi:hypothetical protein
MKVIQILQNRLIVSIVQWFISSLVVEFIFLSGEQKDMEFRLWTDELTRYHTPTFRFIPVESSFKVNTESGLAWHTTS